MKIKLNKMRFHSYIGYFEQERVVGQDILVSIVLTLPEKDVSAYLADDLEQTVNYGEVYQLIADLIQNNHEIKLLETLAAMMIEQIHAHFPDQIDLVQVQIEKLNLPIDGILDSAEVELAG
ncbi:dihydroneopterin aldolase [Weissella uvarum]|uniref:dihydroneopterin aldolase n=1 Tax=Weissella uvarum TaxID=1479233 RepID=UPI001961649E|nr:dihydroneopterin aldolase [Weissella uvarum]MCM0594995.1 dihydroneopterin aldolase [Weissella uvarum]